MLCSVCGFEAKTGAGLDRHKAAKHPQPECGPVESAVRRDLADVEDADGLVEAMFRVAARLDESMSARDLPGLSAELRAGYAQLGKSVTDVEEGKDTVDDLAARRVARFADAKDQVKPA